MSDDKHEVDGLIVDDDPVLDYILYEEMLEENKKHKNAGGCLALFILFLLPSVTGFLWLVRMS